MVGFEKIASDLHMANRAGRLGAGADGDADFLRHYVGDFVYALFVGCNDAVD